MPDGSTFTPPASNRVPAPPEVWKAVRADYVAGATAEDCSRRHGVPVGTLRHRAAREGWRRADLPWVPANTLDALDEGVQLEDRVRGDLDRVELGELAYVASRRMMRCVLRGDAAGALRWRRVRLVLEAEDQELTRAVQQQEALGAERGTALDAWRPSDGVSQPGR